MDYSRSAPGKGVLKRPVQNSNTNHRSQPTHKTDSSLRLRDEDSPVRERAKPFSHNPSILRGGSKKRTRNEDLEDHLEVNSPVTNIHTNDPESEEHIGSTSNGTFLRLEQGFFNVYTLYFIMNWHFLLIKYI